jgi:hypothetical protein
MVRRLGDRIGGVRATEETTRGTRLDCRDGPLLRHAPPMPGRWPHDGPAWTRAPEWLERMGALLLAARAAAEAAATYPYRAERWVTPIFGCSYGAQDAR